MASTDPFDYDAIERKAEQIRQERKASLPSRARALFDADPDALDDRGRTERTAALEDLARRAEVMDPGERLVKGVKATKEGELGFLADKYGKENVIPIRGAGGVIDNFMVLRKDAKPLVAESLEGFLPELSGPGLARGAKELVGDVADVGADAAEAVAGGAAGAAAGVPLAAAGALVGGAAGSEIPGVGNLAGGAIGGAAGRVAGQVVGAAAARGARQAASAALPGEDFPEGGRASDIAAMGAAGGIGGAIGEAGGAAWRYLSPKSFLARKVAKDTTLAGKSAVQEAAGAYAAAGDVPLTLGQATGSPVAMRAEATLRKAYPTEFARGDFKALQATSKAVDDALASMPGSGAGREEAGKRVALAYRAHLDALDAARKKAADVAFGEARMLAGNGRYVAPTETQKALADIIATHGKSGTAPLREILDTTKAGWSIEQLQNQLARIGKATQGHEALATNLDRSANEQVANRLFAAMRADLERTAAAPLVGRGPGGKLTPKAAGDAARALVKARDAYRVMSEAMEASRNDVLEQTFKRMGADADVGIEGMMKGDALVKKILSSDMADGDVAKLMETVKGVDPAAAEDLTRAAVEEIVGRGASAGSSEAVAAGARWSPVSLADALLSAKPGSQKALSRLGALLGEKSPQYQAILQVARNGQKIGRTIGTAADASASGIGLRAIGIDPERLANARMSDGVMLLARKLGRLLSGQRGITEAVMSPKASMQMLGLMRTEPSKWTAAGGGLLAQFIETLEDQQGGDPLRDVVLEGPQ